MDSTQLSDSKHDSASIPYPQEPRNETCIQYKITSEKNGTEDERDLILDIHFQSADYPSVYSGKPPRFSYVIRRAKLELSLSLTKMPIENIVPVEKFHMMTEHDLKDANAGEFSAKAVGEVSYSDKGPGAKGSLEVGHKSGKSSEKTMKAYHSSVKYRHLSDQFMTWAFSPNDGYEFLSGTLSKQPLGKLQGCRAESLAHCTMQVLECDVEAKAPEHLKKLGKIGLVIFKVQRAAIVSAMNMESHQRVWL